MKCPVCNTVLILQNDNYFCPNCKLYVGPNNEEFKKKYSAQDTNYSLTSTPNESSSQSIQHKNITLKVPTFLLIISLLLFISGILGIFGSIAGLLLFFLSISSQEPVFALFASIIGIPLILIGFLLSVTYLSLSYGLRLLRRWAFYISIGLGLLSVLAFLYLLTANNLDFRSITGFTINLFITFYMWSQSSLFISKKELASRGVNVDASFPLWAKVIIGLIILIVFLPCIAIITIAINANLYKNSLKKENNKTYTSEQSNYQNRNLSYPSSTPSVINGFIEYKDSKGRYSFRYPQTWFQDINSESLVSISSKDVQYARMWVIVKPGKSDIQEYVKEIINKENTYKTFKLLESQPAQISSLPALKLIYTHNNVLDYKFLNVITTKDNSIYLVGYSSTVDNYSKAEPDVQAILESFKLY